MVGDQDTEAGRVRQLDGVLALLEALRDTATDRTELERCEAAWRVLSMDRRALLADLTAGNGTRLAARRPAASAHTPGIRGSGTGGGRSRGMKLRVCVFDNDPAIRAMLETVLEQRGYEVFVFADPAACPLRSASSCVCASGAACTDAIISDLNMPLVEGLAFVEEQRAKGCQCQHIALMSGFWREGDVRRALDLGCEVFLKPFRMADLQAWLDGVEQAIDPSRTLMDWHRDLPAGS